MTNVDLKVEGSTLVVRVDLSKSSGPSRSGNTVIVASTEGNADVPGFDGFKIGLNVFKYSQ